MQIAKGIFFSYLLKGGTGSQALKRAKIIDSDNEDEVPGVEGNDNEQKPQQLIDEGGESSDEGVRNDADQGCVKSSFFIFYFLTNYEIYLFFVSQMHRGNDFVNDFEAMLAKKREDGTKRRKRRDIDIINDNDDIIDQLIQDMRAAADV